MKHIRTTITLVVLASLAMMAAAKSSQKHKPKVRTQPAAVKMVPAPPAVNPSTMSGTWTMREGDKPRRDIRMVFRPDGTFAFLGPNWQSSGTYRLQDHTLSLEWSRIDGEKVAPGTVKKDIAMAEDDGSFTIDKYTYFKL